MTQNAIYHKMTSIYKDRFNWNSKRLILYEVGFFVEARPSFVQMHLPKHSQVLARDGFNLS